MTPEEIREVDRAAAQAEMLSLMQENAKLRAEVERLKRDVDFQASLYRDAAAARDKHWKSLQASDLLLSALRKYVSNVCDVASQKLDAEPIATERHYWGARLRLAQEICQMIDAKDIESRVEEPHL